MERRGGEEQLRLGGPSVNDSPWTADECAQLEQRLGTLERLLELEATELQGALMQAAQLMAETLGADKVDVFLYQPATDTLVAVGTSDTPMGRQQRAIGLDRLPVSNGGRTVQVFQSGAPHHDGSLDQDPEELRGVTQGLGARSVIQVLLTVNQEPYGVLQALSAQPEFFSQADLRFLQTAARWVSMVAHRAQLVEQIAQESVLQGRRAAAEELVTVMAHDLRNHLTPLKGRVDLIRRRAVRGGQQAEREGTAPQASPEARFGRVVSWASGNVHAAYLEDADELSRSVARLDRLIGDLLDAGRLDQGRFALTPQPLDLALVVHEVAAAFRSSEAVIEVHSPEELVLEADLVRLRQALENLVANASKHSPAGAPITLTVEEDQTAEGRYAVVRVSDQGPGIPSALLPQLFDRFVSGPGSTGLGLGLYLASNIATAHGGTLTVDSAPGAGATFRLALPVASPPVSG